MIKDFKIDDILNAVNSISKIEIERKKVKIVEDINGNIGHNKQVKSMKSEILVLDQMIE